MTSSQNIKTAFVTGAAGGIGRAITRAFHRAGVRVIGGDIVKPDLSSDDPSNPDLWLSFDVTSEDAVQSAFTEALARVSEIDILVNNAGLVRIAPIEEMSLAAWHETMDVNLTASFLCCREMVRHMKSRGTGGAIINIGSTAGRVGVKNHVHYCASKAGLLGLTKGLALDLAPHQITVNAVCPGPTDTKMLDDVMEEQCDLQEIDPMEYEARIVSSIPLGRKVSPDHIAETVIFLASEQASSITGQTLSVDGGIVRL